jgi:hypothetical protein
MCSMYKYSEGCDMQMMGLIGNHTGQHYVYVLL